MTLAFTIVIAARFLLPLAIPRFPLPAIIGCLVLDGLDAWIFESLGYDPPGYQGYDKAMDVYYLAIAYLATMRNWRSLSAFRVAQGLFFYRLVGVLAFELTHTRALLLIFPNTFEYFFIVYEIVRSRWSPLQVTLRGWLTVAAGIWVLVKLPQEYWIHIAELDVTDLVAARPWLGLLVLMSASLIAAGLTWWFRRRVPPPEWSLRLAAEPLPENMSTAVERDQWHARWAGVRSWGTVEKIVVVGLLAVIYAQVLPTVRSTNAELLVGVAAVVVVNAGFTLALARRRQSLESLGLALLSRVAVNGALVALADWLLGSSGGYLNGGTTLFFLILISLITTLHDRYRPVLAAWTAQPP